MKLLILKTNLKRGCLQHPFFMPSLFLRKQFNKASFFLFNTPQHKHAHINYYIR
jgi:hypothetical protein